MSNFGALLEMIQLFTLFSKKLSIVYEFVKIDHDKAWKISYQQSSGFAQELKTTPFTKYFTSINLTFNYFHGSVPAKK